jgi:Recombinase
MEVVLAQIAEGLNADEIPTPRGGKLWRPSSLEAVLRQGSRA